ncbi:ferric reductase-like transmembrane domain-containing protein [Pseudosulfitobacter koreensis]|uniref:Ferric reductase-like transmembrane domain-containing protein n=1 Tax=Pseudosulfitobacter koreensis TaxID=2968472 RepID=A0ABT1Z1H3_9RHOB|nr:ferric reductase-like transmembrane domain-containing protein [Pseudosulfitobacter koreense]MCR8826998.1 ferric reductase-like transmembrane domain-containing protein [Pseudosulfitobacter koreense]
MRAVLIWCCLAVVIAVPLAVAATSPLLAWRDPVYIAAGFAGAAALAIMLLQPLLAGGVLPGLPAVRGRRVHRWTGIALVLAVILHVGGLWLTSPPDVVDALLFTSPTPFSAWGVVAMWALFGAALLVALRRRWRIRPQVWRLAHTGLVLVVVVGSVVHAMLIVGTMGTATKTMLCLALVAATLKVVIDLRAWAAIKRRRS